MVTKDFRINTDNNYLNRYINGTIKVTLSSYGGVATGSVDHNLGYIPNFDIFSNNNNDGIYWSGGEEVEALTDLAKLTGGFAPTVVPIFGCYATTTKLYIYVFNYTSPTVTGDRSIDYIIYL